MENNLNTLSATQLAAILHRSRTAILRGLREHPDRYPPPLRRVGREPLWLAEEVHDWLLADRTPAPPPAASIGLEKRGRGRPRKQAHVTLSYTSEQPSSAGRSQ